MSNVTKWDYSFYEREYQIPAGTVVSYGSGSCFCRITVNTLEAAKAVQKIVSMDTVYGGWLHGLPLGRIMEHTQPDGTTHYELTC